MARYGLEATVIDPSTAAASVPVRDWIARLLTALRPTLEALGDAEAAEGIERILARGNAADRIREVLARGRTMPELVDWLVGESLLGTGLDRREEQRVAERARGVPEGSGAA